MANLDGLSVSVCSGTIAHPLSARTHQKKLATKLTKLGWRPAVLQREPTDRLDSCGDVDLQPGQLACPNQNMKKEMGSEGDGSHATAGSRQRRWRSIVPACVAHLPWFPHWCILPAAVQQAVAGTGLGCARRPTLHRWNTCSGVGARTGPKPFMQA